MISFGVVMTVYLVAVSAVRGLDPGEHLQLDDMRVPQQLKILDLPFYSSSHILGNKLLARYDFQSYLLPTDTMYSQLDLSKRPFSQRLLDAVLPNPLLCFAAFGKVRSEAPRCK